MHGSARESHLYPSTDVLSVPWLTFYPFKHRMCQAVVRDGGCGSLIPRYRGWLLGHEMPPLWWGRSLSEWEILANYSRLNTWLWFGTSLLERSWTVQVTAPSSDSSYWETSTLTWTVRPEGGDWEEWPDPNQIRVLLLASVQITVCAHTHTWYQDTIGWWSVVLLSSDFWSIQNIRMKRGLEPPTDHRLVMSRIRWWGRILNLARLNVLWEWPGNAWQRLRSGNSSTRMLTAVWRRLILSLYRPYSPSPLLRLRQRCYCLLWW